MQDFDFHEKSYRVVRTPDTHVWVLLEENEDSSTGWMLRQTFDRGIYDYDIQSHAKNWLRREQGEFNG